jgi:peroxiredoxin
LKILVALVTLLLAFPAGAQKAAPNFEALDAQGRKVRLADFAGKTVVLEWTSRSCPFVRAQYDSGVMQELQRWSTGQGVVWLSVLSTHPSRRDYMPPAEADKVHRERGGASTALLMDPDGRMGRAYGAVVTPHMFIIAPDGKLAYAGASGDRSTMDAQEVRASKSFVRAALQDLAAGRKVAAPASRPFGCTIAYSGD